MFTGQEDSRSSVEYLLAAFESKPRVEGSWFILIDLDFRSIGFVQSKKEKKDISAILSNHRELYRIVENCILLKNDGNPISLQERASKGSTCPKKTTNM